MRNGRTQPPEASLWSFGAPPPTPAVCHYLQPAWVYHSQLERIQEVWICIQIARACPNARIQSPLIASSLRHRHHADFNTIFTDVILQPSSLHSQVLGRVYRGTTVITRHVVWIWRIFCPFGGTRQHQQPFGSAFQALLRWSFLPRRHVISPSIGIYTVRSFPIVCHVLQRHGSGIGPP